MNRDTFYYDNLSGKHYGCSRTCRPPAKDSAAYAELLKNNFSRTVWVSGNIGGTLVVSGLKQEIAEDELAYITIEYAVSMISMVQLRILPPQYQADSWKERFVAELLCGNYKGTEADIRTRGYLCGYDFFGTTTVAVFRYDAMWMEVFLAAYADSEEACLAVEQILGRLIEYDKSNPSYCLLPTLEMIVRCGFNLTNAANALFIHYNTLKYRYGKICDIIDLDLSQFENRARIHTAVTLLRLRSSTQTAERQ